MQSLTVMYQKFMMKYAQEEKMGILRDKMKLHMKRHSI